MSTPPRLIGQGRELRLSRQTALNAKRDQALIAPPAPRPNVPGRRRSTSVALVDAALVALLIALAFVGCLSIVGGPP